MMINNSYEYLGYIIEIHEHPIYHDFEFVVKSIDGHDIKGTSTIPYSYYHDAENAAKILINNL